MAIVNEPILLTGSVHAKAGIPYVGLAGEGNSVIPTENVGMSINKGAFAIVQAYQPILVNPEYVYMLDKDVVFLFAHLPEPVLDIISVGYNSLNIPLVSAVESASIATVVDKYAQAVTSGNLSATAYVYNASNQTRSVIVRLYGNTLGFIYTSQAQNIPKEDYISVLALLEITTPTIPIDEILSFTVEGDGADLTIFGTIVPSQIRLSRKNL